MTDANQPAAWAVAAMEEINDRLIWDYFEDSMTRYEIESGARIIVRHQEKASE